jgi:hypothetical protein
MARKAAVVIGVGNTGDLTPLESAVSGAEDVAKWLQHEGYEVECLTDKSNPVRSGHVEDAIAKFVTLPPRYSLLVVYFSGHGYWHALADLWLLSGAPTRASDAINLSGAVDLARRSGIPNVVFISDACRLMPNSLAFAFVKGVDGFPNYAEIPPTQKSKVDVIKAASEALAAYEGPIEGKKQSVLTYALMSAYKQPTLPMVKKVKDGSIEVLVVPNRKLEGYLQDEVNDVLMGIDSMLTQTIEVNILSGDDVYIARAQGPAHPAARKEPVRASRAESVGRNAADAISLVLAGDSPDAEVLMTVTNPATKAQLEARLPGRIVRPGGTIDHLESKVGLVLHGARVVKAVTTKGNSDAFVELLENGDGGDTSALLRLWDVQPAVSVAIELEDGRCIVLAGLEGYIGHASFDEEGLSNVSYVPSSNHWRWPMYEKRKAEIDRLRALIALAVKNNTFQIRTDKEAEALTRTIRMEKSIDPTLGLYAAHAFSQAGNDDSVLSIMSYMRGDLRADLFDVRALASRHVHETSGDYPLAPFCPMLTQTWNVLRPRGIVLPPALEEVVPYLCNSLWTTFQPGVTQHIMHAIEIGELK